MQKQTKDLSYFSLVLENYLRESHPHLLLNTKFIEERSNDAAQSMQEAIFNGANQIEAAEIANQVLFEGLHFSKINVLQNIISEEFPEIPNKRVKKFIIQILPQIDDIFRKYIAVDGDEPKDEDILKLQTELIGCIQIQIEQYGI